jgi:prevent-host-death family protein
MATVKIHEAKTNLSRLIARAEAGEEIIIARDDKPVVKLVAVESAKPGRRPKAGSMKGQLPEIPDEFFFEPWTLEPAQKGLAEEDRAYVASTAPSSGRITVDPAVCGGRPCIRGMRIRVSDVVGMLAAGMERQEILADYPYLESADIDAALAYAAGSAGHRIIRTR